MGRTVGKGLVASGAGCEGIVRRAAEISEVFALIRDPQLEETIILSDTPSATAIVPLLPKVRGVICTSGGVTSHLAIISREFGLACVMAAELEEPDSLEGRRVRIREDGSIALAET